jgi:hypothetical protein
MASHMSITAYAPSKHTINISEVGDRVTGWDAVSFKVYFSNETTVNQSEFIEWTSIKVIKFL